MAYDLEFDARALKGWHKLGQEKTWRRVRDQLTFAGGGAAPRVVLDFKFMIFKEILDSRSTFYL
ncbi:hypothetical protein N015_01755 [Pseudomonas asturiensis]|uniref:Addiction module toxin RelE n=1 Tax=Pseudomonas asturiensis TaxID=1190415 RepID=A0ABX6H6M9_9PSED|nr:hypothetical protein [Pseudomonas asturiensis]QHF01197.1 hypothetical protein N015_01755 [Pseudomonas asturiensis]